MLRRIFWLLVILSACKQGQTVTKVKQGIEGSVIWREGNFMPQIGEKKEIIIKPISREIHVYEPTRLTELRGQPPFFTQPRTRRIAIVQSDEKGKFYVELPEGTYSLFVKEEKGLYANLFDKDGTVYPVTVKNQAVTTIEIIIDYKSSY
ncbi:MAG: carboxypeptidase regulatory-like domain-containing protein [Flammeovirgaceae bacterium]|nr:carboxypeptidase regulatory-like domain-containing protein [Flammeovirgaceae bacterium]MDW8287709.1 carboxypeptidase regulatory-like domain-containing protein [Flammeovirgaceae bacterium]